MPLDYNLHQKPAYDIQRGAMGLPDGENVIVSVNPASANPLQRLRHGGLLRDYLLS